MTRQPADLSKILMEDWEFDTPEQCRERRRRRIQMRRLRWGSGHYFSRLISSSETCLSADRCTACTNEMQHDSSAESESESESEVEDGTVETAVRPPVTRLWVSRLLQNPMPDYGKISLIRRSEMSLDDTMFAKEDFCRVNFLGGQPMHFFAVFDAHGDPHVSTECKQLMHMFVAEELRRVSTTGWSATGDGNLSLAEQEEVPEEANRWQNLVRTALERSFQRMHRLAQGACSCGNFSEYACPITTPAAGSTAVVVILTAQHIVIANCGTSRAVLCRAGTSFPLSQEYKPERLDEQERIRAVDGRISFHNGQRVYGILNMSHSPGAPNINLKPVTTLEPQISITKREANEDECLILANEGIWDAVSDDMACRVASTCLRYEGPPPNTDPTNHFDLYHPHTHYDETDVFLSINTNRAAAILCRLALARGSHDDKSVIVVDLNRAVVDLNTKPMSI